DSECFVFTCVSKILLAAHPDTKPNIPHSPAPNRHHRAPILSALCHKSFVSKLVRDTTQGRTISFLFAFKHRFDARPPQLSRRRRTVAHHASSSCRMVNDLRRVCNPLYPNSILPSRPNRNS